MKKFLIFVIGIILILIIAVSVMFILKICPPVGPWPTPPWCSGIFIRNEYLVNTNAIHLPQIKAVNMSDTWGRNYNMSMVESTRQNIESSFVRVKELGASEIYVHDFDRAIFEKNADFTTTRYKIGDEIFLNDMRDESMTESDIKNLVLNAHQNGLELGIKRNMSFVDIGKYIIAGISGEIQSTVETDYKKFNSLHTKEWIKDYFEKWTARIVEKASIYQKYGVDIMSITPTWMGPTFAGEELLVNELQKKLIEEVRKVFNGKVYVELSLYGFFEDKDGKEDWTKYNYYKNADIVEIRIYDLLEHYRNGDIEKEIPKYLTDLNNIAKKKEIKLSIFFAPSSYVNSMKYGPLEVLDYKSEKVKNAISDFNYQAKVFEIFFNALPSLNNIERINVASFAWDDALDPQIKPKLSVASTFRNKPAESVIKEWFNK
ncbi:MAG: hypothetical protein WCW93_00540 [Candidatus Paceibacterota bacterium]